MEKVRLAIVFYSKSGTNYQLATWAEQAGLEAGAEVRLRRVAELAPQAVIDSVPEWKAFTEKIAHIPEVSLDDLEWADSFIFSTPTRFGNMTSQMRQFLDTTGPIWAAGKLANKTVSAMTSAGNPHGGQESTLLSLYNTMYHWGAIIVPPGFTDASISKAGGNPYGLSVTIDQTGKIVEDARDAVFYQTKRTVQFAQWIKAGKEALA